MLALIVGSSLQCLHGSSGTQALGAMAATPLPAVQLLVSVYRLSLIDVALLNLAGIILKMRKHTAEEGFGYNQCAITHGTKRN